MDHSFIFIILACGFGLFMTWGVGANDLANVMSTTMGSRAISVRQAIIIAVIFEFAGAFLAGGGVTETIRHGIFDVQLLSSQPETLIYGMLAVLLAGSTWMLFASYQGLPVSITHTIIGSIIGFAVSSIGVDAVNWDEVSLIGASWLSSPIIAAIFAYGLFLSIQHFILGTATPLKNAIRYAPFYLFAVGLIMSITTVLKGICHLGMHLAVWSSIAIAICTAFLTLGVGTFLIRRLKLKATCPEGDSLHTQFIQSERIFAVLMLFTACAMVFAHGSNDVANAVGPMATIMSIVQHEGKIVIDNLMPHWILFMGCSGVVIGFLMYGRKVIATVGGNITTLTPSRAFAATLAAAATVVFATTTGIPVSATQTLVGAVLGVGLARGIGALNLRVIRNIFMSWIITLPAGALLTIIYFHLFQFLFK